MLLPDPTPADLAAFADPARMAAALAATLLLHEVGHALVMALRGRFLGFVVGATERWGPVLAAASTVEDVSVAEALAPLFFVPVALLPLAGMFPAVYTTLVIGNTFGAVGDMWVLCCKKRRGKLPRERYWVIIFAAVRPPLRRVIKLGPLWLGAGTIT